MVVEKDGVTKIIDSEMLAADYIAAGWKEVEDAGKPKGKSIQFETKGK